MPEQLVMEGRRLEALQERHAPRRIAGLPRGVPGPTLTVTPSPAPRPSTIDVRAAGLAAGTRYNLRVDGTVILTGRALRDGTLAGGASIGATSTVGSHTAQLRDSANKVTLASLAFAVGVVEPPPPPPPPPPPSTNEPAWATAVKAELRAANANYVNKGIQGPSLTGAQLNAIIAATAAGTRLIVAPGTTIDLTGQDGISFKGKTRIELMIHGCTVLLNTDGVSNFGNCFFFENSHWCAVRGGTVKGSNRNTGTALGSLSQDEQKNGAGIRYNTDHIELDGIEFLDLDGFGILVTCDGGGPGPLWPSQVYVHGCTFTGGVMAFGMVAVRDFIAEGNLIKDTNWSPFDFEPDYNTDGYVRVLVQDNTINGFGWEALAGGHTHWLLAMNPANIALASQMIDLTFQRNHVVRGHVPGGGQNAGGGGVLCRFDKSNVKQGVTIVDNTSDDPRLDTGASIYGNAVRDGVIIRNRQKLVGGAALYAHNADNGDVPDANMVVTPNFTT